MPKEMEEAARLDGLSEWGILWKIAFPLMAPGITVIGVVTFNTSWNEFLFAASFSTAYLKTGPVAISSMIAEWTIAWGPLASSGIYWSIPIIIVAILFNRRLIRAFTLRYYG
jgi:ABC-type glycerol-3-phosphate transport system permease component